MGSSKDASDDFVVLLRALAVAAIMLSMLLFGLPRLLDAPKSTVGDPRAAHRRAKMPDEVERRRLTEPTGTHCADAPRVASVLSEPSH